MSDSESDTSPDWAFELLDLEKTHNYLHHTFYRKTQDDLDFECKVAEHFVIPAVKQTPTLLNHTYNTVFVGQTEKDTFLARCILKKFDVKCANIASREVVKQREHFNTEYQTVMNEDVKISIIEPGWIDNNTSLINGVRYHNDKPFTAYRVFYFGINNPYVNSLQPKFSYCFSSIIKTSVPIWAKQLLTLEENGKPIDVTFYKQMEFSNKMAKNFIIPAVLSTSLSSFYNFNTVVICEHDQSFYIDSIFKHFGIDCKIVEKDGVMDPKTKISIIEPAWIYNMSASFNGCRYHYGNILSAYRVLYFGKYPNNDVKNFKTKFTYGFSDAVNFESYKINL